jgi:hypothetical protein
MQQDKITKRNSELEVIASDSEKLSSSLADVMKRFNLEKHSRLFDFLKSKGFAVSSLINILVMLPFVGISSICALVKCRIYGIDMQGQKDVYYEIKNNEYINWRQLLLLHVKRFIYLINNDIHLKIKGITAFVFDDTLLEKTGRKIEKVSVVNDHVSKRFILGYKLLVCGFWNGGSFIPVDFSLHREKGNKHIELIKDYHKATKILRKTRTIIAQKTKSLADKQNRANELAQLSKSTPTATNQANYKRSEKSCNKVKEQLIAIHNELAINQKEHDKAKKALANYYKNNRLFGMTAKERKEQYKKAVSISSHGFKRRKEADRDKISCMLEMLRRVVKMGIIADYVLIDSWFFCTSVLEELNRIKKGTIKLVSMVKINNQVFKLCKTDKEMSVKAILQSHLREVSTCKEFKSQYIKVACWYGNIRTNLFYVKMGKSSKWHLLLTTDLELSFIKMMQVYQIRWGIEIFFKESKQYLNLSGCQSMNFDAQIAHITLSMFQHIMLSYCKRLNYQLSFGGLFEEMKREMIEMDLVNRLLEILWELIEIMCDSAGIDFILFQEDAMRDDRILTKFINLLPEKVIDKAA